MKKVILIVVSLALLLMPIVACASSSEPKPFPPPEGYSSWDEYYEDYYKGDEPSVEIPSPPTASPIPEPETTTPPKVSASLEILTCEQTYYEHNDSWGNYVAVDYEITNTGEVDIFSYDIYFTAKCKNGEEYEDSDGFVILDVGETCTNFILIDVDGNEVSEVEISDWELECIGLDIVSKSAQDPTPTLSCSPKEPPLNASFKIKDWEQPYYDSLHKWGIVEVYYEIENTGTLDIDYYEVYFIVECMGGQEYYDWTNGTNVRVGKKMSGHTMIDVGDYEARSVEIDDWELKHY